MFHERGFVTCEICQTSHHLHDIFLVAALNSDWMITCFECIPANHLFKIPCRSMFRSPGAVIDWLAHLSEKPWFIPDQFFNVMDRLRTNGHFFNSM